MRLARILIPLSLIAWPILEIATLIWVGGRLGVFSTIALLIGAGVLGTALVRLQGLKLIAEIQTEVRGGRLPADKILHGAMLAVAGLLLLLPGFLTDVPGFLLLLPPVRQGLIALMRANMTVVTTVAGETWTRRDRPGVVDLDPEDYARKDGRDTPWSDDDRDPPAIGRYD